MFQVCRALEETGFEFAYAATPRDELLYVALPLHLKCFAVFVKPFDVHVLGEFARQAQFYQKGRGDERQAIGVSLGAIWVGSFR